MRYQKKKLKNGLVILGAPQKETKAVTLLILFKVGSRYEKRSINGLAHFIEHMLFKGTEKRPSTWHIAQELDQLGAEYNAMTSKDFTGYYIKVNHEKLEAALAILSDMIFHSRLDKKMISQEKKVIIEEINMYRDNPMLYINDLFEQTVYGQKSFLGQLISGSKNSVNSLSRDKLINFLKKHYHVGNMLLVAAGHCSLGQLVKLTEKHFVDLKKKPASPFKKAITAQTKPRVSLISKKTEQVQIGLGFPAYSYFHKDIYALEVLNNILGGMMSSRLFIEIRVKRGLCYSINSSLNTYQDTGNIIIQAGLDKSRIKEAIAAILEELRKIKKEGVGQKELKKAQDNIKGHLILQMEDSENRAAFLGKQHLLTKKIITPEQLFRKIGAVTTQDIKRVTQDIFLTRKLNLAIIGPFDEIKTFEQLLNKSF